MSDLYPSSVAQKSKLYLLEHKCIFRNNCFFSNSCSHLLVRVDGTSDCTERKIDLSTQLNYLLEGKIIFAIKTKQKKHWTFSFLQLTKHDLVFLCTLVRRTLPWIWILAQLAESVTIFLPSRGTRWQIYRSSRDREKNVLTYGLFSLSVVGKEFNICCACQTWDECIILRLGNEYSSNTVYFGIDTYVAELTCAPCSLAGCMLCRWGVHFHLEPLVAVQLTVHKLFQDQIYQGGHLFLTSIRK